MLSAIVIYLNENDAGPGFYRFAAAMGLLRPAASKDQRFDFWLRQVHLVHNHYQTGQYEPSPVQCGACSPGSGCCWGSFWR